MLIRHYLAMSLIAIAISVCTAVAAPPQDGRTISGTVTAVDGAPLEDVDVIISELGRKVSTDDAGHYVFSDLPEGTYTILFQRLGYATASKRVDLSVVQSTTLDVSLRAMPLMAPPVTVTASREAIDLTDSPLPVSTVDAEELRRHHSVSMAHVLEQQPGVRTLSTGEQIGKPVIRGLSGSRVLVVDNGLRLEDYSWSDEDAPSVDARMADRLEIVRGPLSVLYGSDALGGVVNVIPEPLPDASGQQGYTHAGVEIYGASSNAEGGLIGQLEGVTGSIGWRALLTGRVGQNFSTPTGELENTGFWAVNGELAGGVSGDWGNADLRFVHYGGVYHLLEANEPPAGGEENAGPRRILDDERVQLNGQMPFASMRLEGHAQFQRHFLAEEPGDEQGGGNDTGEEEFELVLNTFTLDLLAHHRIGDDITGTVGISGMSQGNEPDKGRHIVPAAEVISGAVFAFERLDLGPVEFLGGARIDGRSLNATADPVLGMVADDSRSYLAVTGSLGAVWHPIDEMAVTANVGRAWRAPNYFELYANGPRIGDARYEIGRSDLNPETSLNFDGGIRLDFPAVRISFNAFQNRITDYIYIERSGDSLESLPVYRHHQADAVLTGGEGQVTVEPIDLLSVSARYDMVRGDNQQTDQPLPLMPPQRGAISVELHSTELGWADRAWLSVELEGVDKQTNPAPSDQVTAGYGLVNLGAGMQAKFLGHDVRIDARVTNLADHAYRDFLSRYKGFALDPGRNIVLHVGVGM